jgi:hypothetical protein
MSDTQSILLQVKIDEAAANKKLQELAKQIEYNKRAQAALNKEIKASDIITDEQAKRQQILQQEYKELTGEVKLQTYALSAQQKAEKAKTGSINQLREQLKTLTAQWNDLSEEERENAEIGGQIEKATKATSDKLKELEGKVGDTRRNVGNYTGALLEAADGSGQLSQTIDTLKETYAKLSEFLGEAKEAILDEVKAKIAAKEATIASNAATAAGTAATGAHTTVTNVSKAAIIGQVGALKLLKFALAATGIGAVLLLLGGLISFLTRTQEGMDKVSQVTAGFSKVMGFLFDRLAAVGKATIDWFKDINNLGDFLEKLAKGALENIISRLKGFAVILDGIINRDFTKIQDGIVQVGTGIKDATAKTKAFAEEMAAVARNAAQIEKEYQRIARAERDLNVKRQEANAFIEKNKMLAEDATKSEAVRAEAAQKAFSKEEELRTEQLKLQKEKIANIIAEQKLTNNLNADNDKLAEAKAELAKIEAESFGKSTELQNKLNDLRKQAQQKQLEATQKQLEAEAQLLEIRTKSSVISEEGVLELQAQILKKKMQQELLAEGLTQAQVQAIKARYQSEEETMRNEFREEQRQKEIEEAERTNNAAFEASQKALDIAYSRQDMQLKEHRAKGLLTEEEYTRQVERLKLTQLQGEVVALEQFQGKIEGIDTQIAAKRLEISNYLTDEKIKNLQREEVAEQARMQQRQELMLADLEYSGEVMNMLSEQTAMLLTDQGASMQEFATNVLSLMIDTVARALEAQVAASVGAATVQAIASAESVATFGVAGVAKALALVALIRGASMAAKAAMQNAISGGDAPKFAAGGYTGSGFGTPDDSGYKVAGVVHEGEYVAPKWMVNSNPTLFSELERKRLKGYATGGFVQPPATRAFLSGDAGMDYSKLAGAVAQEMSKVNIYTKVTDVSRAQGKQAAKARITNQ